MHRCRLERTEDSYTLDDLFNLVELMYDIQDYTHRMFLVPELGVVLAHRAMLQEVLAVLCTKDSSLTTCGVSPADTSEVAQLYLYGGGSNRP